MELLNKILEQPDTDKKILMLAIYKSTYDEIIKICVDPALDEDFDLIINQLLKKKDQIKIKIEEYNNG